MYSAAPRPRGANGPEVLRKPRRIWPWLLSLFLVVASVAAWQAMKAPGGLPGGPPSGSPPSGGAPSGGIAKGARGDSGAGQAVSVATVIKADIPVNLTSLGTVTSLATATIKSQISGYLSKIDFKEGDTVKKGDELAQIDPRPYQVLLEQYEGQLAKDQALLDNARLDLQRYEKLIKQDSTSKQTYDTAAATVRQYEGTVRGDQAQVDAQKLNLVYCRIVSPVDGRVGLRQVDIGNYVSASDSTGIVVVTQATPTSVLFTLPEDSIRPLMKRLQAGAKLTVTAYDRASVEKLAEGTLDSVDSQIDTSTGTVKLRALFANADSALFPNQFVNVVVLLDTLKDMPAVPSRAIQTGIPGTFVYKLKSDNTVSLQKVTIGQSASGMVAIQSGLNVGDRIVVDGLDRLSDGAKVTVESREPKTQDAGTAAASGASR